VYSSVERSIALAYLLCFAELLNNLGGHLKVLQQVISYSVPDPGGALGRTQLQQLVPGLLQRRQAAHVSPNMHLIILATSEFTAPLSFLHQITVPPVQEDG